MKLKRTHLYCIVNCVGRSVLNFEEPSSSRQSIEERLIEEYRNCSYSSDARAELDRIVQDKGCFSRPKSHTITYHSSFLHQLRWVLQRTFQNLMLNPQISVAQVNIHITYPRYRPRQVFLLSILLSEVHVRLQIFKT